MLIYYIHFVACSRACTESIDMTYSPLIFSKKFDSSQILCINSSHPYLTAVFNQWNGAQITTYRTANGSTIKDGPYSYNMQFDGFDFGSTIGSIEIEMKKKTELSIGLIVFNKSSDIRIVSNHQKDEILFDSNKTESLDLGKNQYTQYFNASPGHREFYIDMDTEPKDCLTILNGNISTQYCGQINTEKRIENSLPVIFELQTDNDTDSNYVRFTVVSEFKGKRYIRHITNGQRYQALIWFKYDHLSVGAIIGIVIACVVVVILIGIVISFVFFSKKRKNNEI
ncbi:hypothetical protein TRFO_28247 [Tritrichomonas foetus]|uniref:Uncharacterized protein n=1 Tax=Tritrichomonas foetus TaxID=1144522 RepID=A0A1J4JZ65_9EUKA|nr:hypothetical protein TRFO_28247 [Tritrichomonas foetus]|eukprot:OHT04267.1 hypothetical protein TRFO_28247 [Tritrichomonas foetus]